MELVRSPSPFDRHATAPARRRGAPTRAHQHPATRPQRWEQDETKPRRDELAGNFALPQQGNEVIAENAKHSYQCYHDVAKTLGVSLDEARARYGTPPATRGEPAPPDSFRFTGTAALAPTLQAFATETLQRPGGRLLSNQERLLRNVLAVTGRSLEPPEETRQAPAKRSWWQWG